MRHMHGSQLAYRSSEHFLLYEVGYPCVYLSKEKIRNQIISHYFSIVFTIKNLFTFTYTYVSIWVSYSIPVHQNIS